MKLPIDFESHLTDSALEVKNPLKTKIISYSWHRFFQRFIIKKINLIRTINDKMFEDLIAIGFPKNRILKIPNGINFEKFRDISKIDNSETHFGYVGRLSKYKNVIFLLNVFKAHLNEFPRDILLLYGTGPEETVIKHFISRNKLENNIILRGFEKDKTKIYSLLDVLINPALSQGISNANLEAMCTKTLIIAANVYGNRELIKHKENGLLFNPRNMENLLEQLKFYKNNFELTQKMVDNAFSDVVNIYDIKRVTKKIYNALKMRMRKEV